jgi:hypothetical protein
MIRQHDASVDVKWISFACAVCCFTQRIDLVGQKSATAIEEIGREESAPAWHKRATIIGHPRKLTDPERGAIKRLRPTSTRVQRIGRSGYPSRCSRRAQSLYCAGYPSKSTSGSGLVRRGAMKRLRPTRTVGLALQSSIYACRRQRQVAQAFAGCGREGIGNRGGGGTLRGFAGAERSLLRPIDQLDLD